MNVTIYGPNLPTQGETFHVHAAGCSDTRKGIYPRLGADQGGWTIAVGSVQEAVEAVYSDQIAESDDWGWEDYAADVKFFPCTEALPLYTIPAPPDHETALRTVLVAAEAWADYCEETDNDDLAEAISRAVAVLRAAR